MKKKSMLFIISIISLLVLTGCGETKISCTREETIPFGNFYDLKLVGNATIIVDKDDIVSDANIKVELIFPEDVYQNMKDGGDVKAELEQMAVAFSDGISNKLGDKISLSSHEVNKNIITFYFEPNMKDYEFLKTKNAIIKEVEEDGFICK